MSTQRLLPKRCKGMGRSVVSPLSLLAGVLLIWQLVLPSVALAFQAHPGRIASPPLAPEQEALDIASVSVVRLVVSYTLPPQANDKVPPVAVVQCTGLGSLVGSWQASSSTSTEKNNWVLTDSSLVSTRGVPCAPSVAGVGRLVLSSIQILANTTYTASGTLPKLLLLGQLHCQTATKGPTCSDLPTASSAAVPENIVTSPTGAVLFTFHTDAQHLQPFLDIASSSPAASVTPTTTATGLVVGIELANTAGSWPQQALLNTPDEQQAVQQAHTVLDPQAVRATGTPTPTVDQAPEAGMPVVNSQGQLVGMHLMSGSQVSAQAISTLLNAQADWNASVAQQQANVLHTAWDAGIADFYLGHYTDAQNALQQANGQNADFQALPAFEMKVTTAQKNATGNGGNTGNGLAAPSDFFGIPFWVLAVVGLVVLLAIFVLVSLNFGRKRAQKRQELAHFKADELEAQRRAEIEVQRQTSALGNRGNASNQQAQFVPDLRCPLCNYPVQANATYCPNCRALLSPSASGLHLHAIPPSQPAQHIPDYAPSPPQMSPQPAYAQPPPSLIPASSMSEQPTIEMSPDKSKNGQSDPEKTVPYSVQQLHGRNLSLAVGSRSDPGIKRKHKPNEDSLFAMQGARTHNSQPQQFGLFVVADGMGGHANGQDASRLAIQTIIDYILPKVSTSNNMDDAAFLKLLSDGVQCANEAVHKRNMEEHADMGTTMTAALVVGSSAYIANVGDSRTYLYREPEGLQKITRDHSVVASLVDAGIIQPDDIYTHPKRNQIYRSLGEKPVVEVDSFQVSLQSGDKLLLCSDGLWDMVRDPEIQRLMSNPAPDPNMTGNALIQAALNGGGEDNVSVIVVSITETSNRTGITGIQLLAKPDSVTVPEMPSMQ